MTSAGLTDATFDLYALKNDTLIKLHLRHDAFIDEVFVDSADASSSPNARTEQDVYLKVEPAGCSPVRSS